MQDTKELKTPGGHTVLVRGTVNGMVGMAVKRIMAGGYKPSVSGSSDKFEQVAAGKAELDDSDISLQVDPGVKVDADMKLCELMTLAVDGNNGNPYQDLMNLPYADANFVVEELNTMFEEGNVDPKANATTSSSSSTS